MKTSAVASRSSRRSRSAASRRSSTTLRLPRLSRAKAGLGMSSPMPSDPKTSRIGSPVGGSTLMTSAPQSASSAAAAGAATHTPSSTTRRPASAPRPAAPVASGAGSLTTPAPGRSAARGPQLVLLDLAGGVDGQLVDDLDRPGHLVVGDLVAAPRQDLGADRRVARPGHDEGHADLAEPLVGDADHRRLLHVGVAQQVVLDLGRVGVEAADDEHVLGPARRSAGSRASSSDAEVAGAQPAVGRQRLGGGRRGRRGSRPSRWRPAAGSRRSRPRARRRRRWSTSDAELEARAGPGRRWWRSSRGRRRARWRWPCRPR